MVDPGTAALVVPFVSLFAKFFERAIESIPSETRKLFPKHAQAIKKYMKATHTRCTKIKTIINKTKPLNIKEIYVNSLIGIDETVVSDVDFLSRIEELNKITIHGTGGAGKTLFMRWLWLNIANSSNKIPIFFELRNIEQKSVKLEDAVFESIKNCSSDMSRPFFDYLLESGKIVLLFDGFDELPDEATQKSVEKGLIKIAHSYPDTIMVVTGRGADSFYRWQMFSNLELKPFTREMTKNLIEKLPFDQVLKASLLEKLNETLFESHSTMFSTPLLVLVMVVYFGEYGRFPQKEYKVYEEAFQVLFMKHDLSKDGYVRIKKTNLEMDLFKAILGTFCFQSYYNVKFEFSDQLIRKFVRDALEFEGVTQVSDDNFIDDLVNAVCILSKEGGKYRFVHRRFQEYYCATVLARPSLDSSVTEEALLSISNRPNENVVSILYDLEPSRVTEFLLVPTLSELEALLDPVKGDLARLKLYWSSYTEKVDFGTRITEDGSEYVRFVGRSRDKAYRLSLLTNIFHPKKNWSITGNVFEACSHIGDLRAVLKSYGTQLSGGEKEYVLFTAADKRYVYNERLIKDLELPKVFAGAYAEAKKLLNDTKLEISSRPVVQKKGLLKKIRE